MAKRFKTTSNNLSNIFQRIQSLVRDGVIKGSSESLQEGTQRGLSSISVIGTTAQSYRNKPAQGAKSIVVGSILRGLGAWGTEKGVNDPIMQSLGYGGDGKFVSFQDEPHLRDWAEKVGVNTSGNGLVVGRSGRTSYGTKSRQWFTNTTIPYARQDLERSIRKQLKN